jgi:hypothetical protein
MGKYITILVSVCALQCCSQPFIGVTKCGVALVGWISTPSQMPEPLRPGYKQDGFKEFQQAETDAIELLSHSSDPRMQNACQKLQGTLVYINAKDTWYTHDGRHVSGLTNCGAWEYGVPSVVEVGNVRFTQSSLAHEFAHVLQKCQAIPPVDSELGEDDDHAGWHRTGIYAAIDKFNKPRSE